MAALQPSQLRRANSKRQMLEDAAESEETVAVGSFRFEQELKRRLSLLEK